MRIFSRFYVVGLSVVTNGKISFAFVLACLCSVGELNFSQDFMNERRGIASVAESLFKVSFVFIKVLLD